MTRGQAPYDDYVMDHIRNARNFRVLENANRESKGSNPLCGDTLTVRLHVARGRVEDAAFRCECCGVSMASASMMTEWVKGREVAEARQFSREFAGRLASRAAKIGRRAGPMERALLGTARDFPARAGCAVLPWSTLVAALQAPTGPEPGDSPRISGRNLP